MTAVEDARFAVLEAAQQVISARSDTARARANRHLDDALHTWADASRPFMVAAYDVGRGFHGRDDRNAVIAWAQDEGIDLDGTQRIEVYACSPPARSLALVFQLQFQGEATARVFARTVLDLPPGVGEAT